MVPWWERLWALVKHYWWLAAAGAAAVIGAIAGTRASRPRPTLVPPTPPRPQLPDVPAATPTPKVDLTAADKYRARAAAIDADVKKRDVDAMVADANRRYGEQKK